MPIVDAVTASPSLDSIDVETFYEKDLREIPSQAIKILREYSGIAEEDIHDHVIEIREKAWAVHKYPCIGRFAFLKFRIATTPAYHEILCRVKNGALFLDLGCCVGQEIRQLVYDGAPSENLYGTDLQQAFLDLGYKLFRDESTMKAHFFAADIFDMAGPGWALIEGKMDIIWAGSFLHLFGLQDQKSVLKRMISFVKDDKDVLIAGRNLGHVQPSAIEHANAPRKTMYRHNEDSFRKLWTDVAEETGTNWDVQVVGMKLERALGPIGSSCTWASYDTLLLGFLCRRL